MVLGRDILVQKDCCGRSIILVRRSIVAVLNSASRWCFGRDIYQVRGVGLTRSFSWFITLFLPSDHASRVTVSNLIRFFLSF